MRGVRAAAAAASAASTASRCRSSARARRDPPAVRRRPRSLRPAARPVPARGSVPAVHAAGPPPRTGAAAAEPHLVPRGVLAHPGGAGRHGTGERVRVDGQFLPARADSAPTASVEPLPRLLRQRHQHRARRAVRRAGTQAAPRRPARPPRPRPRGSAAETSAWSAAECARVRASVSCRSSSAPARAVPAGSRVSWPPVEEPLPGRPPDLLSVLRSRTAFGPLTEPPPRGLLSPSVSPPAAVAREPVQRGRQPVQPGGVPVLAGEGVRQPAQLDGKWSAQPVSSSGRYVCRVAAQAAGGPAQSAHGLRGGRGRLGAARTRRRADAGPRRNSAARCADTR